MKKKMLVLLASLLVVAGLFKIQAQTLTSRNIRYESSAIWVQNADDIKANLQNQDSVSHNYRVVMYSLSTGSFVSVSDTGTLSISSGQALHSDYVSSTTSPNDYAVEITTDSEKVNISLYIVPGVGSSGVFLPRFWLSQSQFTKFRQQF